MQNQREQPSEEQDLADCEDDRIPTLLKWLGQREVFMNTDSKVCLYEQDVFYVLGCPTVSKDHTKWEATIRVFNVWDQIEQTVTFKVKG